MLIISVSGELFALQQVHVEKRRIIQVFHDSAWWCSATREWRRGSYVPASSHVAICAPLHLISLPPVCFSLCFMASLFYNARNSASLSRNHALALSLDPRSSRAYNLHPCCCYICTLHWLDPMGPPARMEAPNKTLHKDPSTNENARFSYTLPDPHALILVPSISYTKKKFDIYKNWKYGKKKL